MSEHRDQNTDIQFRECPPVRPSLCLGRRGGWSHEKHQPTQPESRALDLGLPSTVTARHRRMGMEWEKAKTCPEFPPSSHPAWSPSFWVSAVLFEKHGCSGHCHTRLPYLTVRKRRVRRRPGYQRGVASDERQSCLYPPARLPLLARPPAVVGMTPTTVTRSARKLATIDSAIKSL